MKVTERFTPIGPDTIDYRVTIDDPKVYTKPWTVALPLNRDDSYADVRIHVPRRELRDGECAELRPQAGPRGRGEGVVEQIVRQGVHLCGVRPVSPP